MNKRTFQKLISALSVFIIMFSTSTNVFASSTDGNVQNYKTSYIVVRDDSKERVAEELIGQVKVVYHLNKKANILTTTNYDSKTNKVISEEIMDLTKILESSDIKKTDKEEIQTYASSSHYQNTFSNYEYQRQGNNYKLRNKSKYVYRNKDKNKSAVNKYIAAVDKLNAAEWAIVSSTGATAMWGVISYLSQGLTTSQAATAAGVSITNVTIYSLKVSDCKRVWNLYVI